MPDVSDDADDLAGDDRRQAHRDLDSLSDRIDGRKILPRERLVDDRDVRVLVQLAKVEKTAAHERHAHRFEIAVVAHADIEQRRLAGRRRRLSDDGEARAGARSGQGEKADRACGLDAR